MANQKVGLNYFTIDTDRYQDMRIKRLKKHLGGLGVAVYDYILCETYRVRGYYCEWNDDVAFDVAEYWGIKETLVQEIVRYCGAVGLFEKELLSRGIITSASIQRRYLDMCARAKRKAPEIPLKLSLIPEEYTETSEECGENSEECEIIPKVWPQSKVKKSKEKKSKEKCVKSAHTHTRTQEEIEIENVFKLFLQWCEQYAPLALAFEEPLRSDQFVWLLKTYGAPRMKQCAADLHDKEAYKTHRNAMNCWKKWIPRVNLAN